MPCCLNVARNIKKKKNNKIENKKNKRLYGGNQMLGR